MKQKQFTNEQIVAILAQAEKGEKPIVEVCREHAVTEVTFYRWRQKFGSVGVKEVQRLRELEKENARLKKLLAERDLEIDVWALPSDASARGFFGRSGFLSGGPVNFRAFRAVGWRTFRAVNAVRRTKSLWSA